MVSLLPTHRVRPALLPVLNVLAIAALLLTLGSVFVVDQMTAPSVPAISERENRTLAPLPVFSWSALKTGDYTRGLDAYVADHFPAREPLLELAELLKSTRGFHVDEVVYDTPDPDVGGLEQTDTWAHADAGPEAINNDDDDGKDSIDDSDTVDAGPALPKVRKKYKSGVSIVNDRALMFLVGDDEHATAFANAVNLYAATLDPAVRIYALVTPTATAFYLPVDQQERSAPEDQNLDAMKAAYQPAIHVVDVYAALAPHVDEDIFFRTDHHWTALGAFYAYAAFCAAAGLPPVALHSLEKKSKAATLGSLYRMTQNKILKQHPDVVDYYLPSVAYTAVRYRDQELKTAAKANFIVEGEKGYVVFLGGDDPMMVAKTEVDNGRKVLLVKNSFGNALAPFLLHNFAEVVVVDYRYYTGSLASLVKSRGITDVILQNATVTANSRPHVRRLSSALLGTGEAWEAETLEKQEARNKKYQEEHGILPKTPTPTPTPTPTTKAP